jgi:Disulfide bond chaperones of the HSP33 family
MADVSQSAKKERVHRFVSNDFTLRIAAVDATQAVREMQKLQNTFPLATVAVGRGMVGAILMASQLKEGQQVGLLFKGSGALRSVYAEADWNGHVRGYTPNPQFIPENYDHGLSLHEAMGKGTLTVARHQPFQKQPFQGTVEMVTGEIGEDIAHYLHQSHQIRSLVSLGVYLDENGQVGAAGGVIIEVMPGVEEALVEKIQQNAEKTKINISKMLKEGATPEDLVRPFLEGVEFQEIEHEPVVSYYCPCTKERVIRALETLGAAELQDMVDKNEEVDVTCQVCGRPYKVTVPEVKELKDHLERESLH